MESVVRLDFEFESGGNQSVDIDKDLLVRNFPDSFFASLFSNRWTNTNCVKILIPLGVIDKPIDALKFRKNIVPLLLQTTIIPTIPIKYERFIDCYLASTQVKTFKIIKDFILCSDLSSTFYSLKHTIIILNWLCDNQGVEIIEKTLNYWKSHFSSLYQYFQTKELYSKYLMIDNIYKRKTNIFTIVDAFERNENNECRADFLQYQPSPFTTLIKNQYPTKTPTYTKNVEQFVDNLRQMCPFIDKLPWFHNSCIAGGSMITTFTNGYYNTRDVDIFIYDYNDGQKYSLVFDVLKIIDDWAKSRNLNTYFVNEKGVISVVVEKWMYSFQVVPIYSTSPKNIIHNFDCDINQCYFDGTNVFCDESFLFAISTNTIHRLNTFKNYRLYRFLEKGFNVADTINRFTFHELCFRHSLNHSIDYKEVMNLLKNDRIDSDHINKHYETDLVFQSDEEILKQLTICYKDAMHVVKNFELLKTEYTFDSFHEIVYVSPLPKYVELDEDIKIKLVQEPQVEKWFVYDENDNVILFALHNVVLTQTRRFPKTYSADIQQLTQMITKIQNLETTIMTSLQHKYPWKSKIFNNHLYFKHFGGDDLIGGKANVLLRPTFVRAFQTHHKNDLPFVFLTFESIIIDWVHAESNRQNNLMEF